MREVIQLQLELEQLGQEEGKGLEKLCFSPMVQVGETTKLHQCTVQSVFGYFKNNLETFEKDIPIEGGNFTHTYLDTLAECFVNAFSLKCMGLYGGPIEPAIAVGGMPPAEPGDNQDYKVRRGF